MSTKMNKLPHGLKRGWLYRLHLNEQSQDEYPGIARYHHTAAATIESTTEGKLVVKCGRETAIVSREEIGERLGKAETPTLQQRAILAAAKNGAWYDDLKAAKMIAGGSVDGMAMLSILGAMIDQPVNKKGRRRVDMKRKHAKKMGYKIIGRASSVHKDHTWVRVEKPYKQKGWMHREKRKNGNRMQWWYTLTECGKAVLYSNDGI